MYHKVRRCTTIGSRSVWEDFFPRHLRPHSHILEVGCGDGTLTSALRQRGHDAVGIDPLAPPGAHLEQKDFAAYRAPARSFDAVIASLSLHHIADLALMLDKIAMLLNSTGVVLVNEYGWERMDERTAQWYHRLWTRLGDRARKGPPPQSAEQTLHTWRGELNELHTAQDLLDALRARFDDREFSWKPYLARELGAPEFEPEEAQSIERGEIAAVGFFYCGALEDV